MEIDLNNLLTILGVFLLSMAWGIMLLFAFLIGARTAQKADRGEEIEVPSINPMEIYKRHEEQRETKEKQEELETNMYNINNYTGDATGQKDFN
jgi:hypothetical protein